MLSVTKVLIGVPLSVVMLVAACSSDGSPQDQQDAGSQDVGPQYDVYPTDTGVADTAPAPDGPTLTELTNAVDGCESVLLIPNAGEEGHLCAARLTPPSYPFTVSFLRYRLGHGAADPATCDATQAHQVELYATTEVAPPAEPDPVVLNIPAVTEADVTPEGRFITEEIDPPLTLTQGEHLFVAIRMVGSYPDVLCVPVDVENAYDADRNYWSNAAAAPYSWVTLQSLGLSGDIIVSALGE